MANSEVPDPKDFREDRICVGNAADKLNLDAKLARGEVISLRFCSALCEVCGNACQQMIIPSVHEQSGSYKHLCPKHDLKES